MRRPGAARRSKVKKGSQFVEGGDAAAVGAGTAGYGAYDTAAAAPRDAYAVGTTDTAIKPTGTAMV